MMNDKFLKNDEEIKKCASASEQREVMKLAEATAQHTRNLKEEIDRLKKEIR
jgi:hypothetical protein